MEKIIHFCGNAELQEGMIPEMSPLEGQQEWRKKGSRKLQKNDSSGTAM